MGDGWLQVLLWNHSITRVWILQRIKKEADSLLEICLTKMFPGRDFVLFSLNKALKPPGPCSLGYTDKAAWWCFHSSKLKSYFLRWNHIFFLFFVFLVYNFMAVLAWAPHFLCSQDHCSAVSSLDAASLAKDSFASLCQGLWSNGVPLTFADTTRPQKPFTQRLRILSSTSPYSALRLHHSFSR